MAIVAGVDFGALSVRVSLVDSGHGLIDSASAEYPAAPRARGSGIRHPQSPYEHNIV